MKDTDLFVKKLTTFVNMAVCDPKVDNNAIISVLELIKYQVCQITSQQYYDRICKECSGTGQVGWNDDNGPYECPMCHGSGEK